MLELLIALGIALGLLAPALLVDALGAALLLEGSMWLIGGGMLLGLPPALIYHVLLYRILGKRGELSRNWLWNPTPLHRKLQGSERRQVLFWFVLGAGGFSAVVAGCLALALGLLGMSGQLAGGRAANRRPPLDIDVALVDNCAPIFSGGSAPSGSGALGSLQGSAIQGTHGPEGRKERWRWLKRRSFLRTPEDSIPASSSSGSSSKDFALLPT